MEAKDKFLIVMILWGVISNRLGLSLEDKPVRLILSTIIVAVVANLIIN